MKLNLSHKIFVRTNIDKQGNVTFDFSFMLNGSNYFVENPTFTIDRENQTITFESRDQPRWDDGSCW